MALAETEKSHIKSYSPANGLHADKRFTFNVWTQICQWKWWHSFLQRARFFPQSRHFLYFSLQFNKVVRSLWTPWRCPITSDNLRKSSVLICGNLTSCNLHTLATSRAAEMSTSSDIWPTFWLSCTSNYPNFLSKRWLTPASGRKCHYSE